MEAVHSAVAETYTEAFVADTVFIIVEEINKLFLDLL